MEESLLKGRHHVKVASRWGDGSSVSQAQAQATCWRRWHHVKEKTLGMHQDILPQAVTGRQHGNVCLNLSKPLLIWSLAGLF